MTESKLSAGEVELEDMGRNHSIWQEADAVRAALPQQPECGKAQCAGMKLMLEKVTEIAIRERQWRYEEHNEHTSDAFMGVSEIGEGIDSLRAEISACAENIGCAQSPDAGALVEPFTYVTVLDGRIQRQGSKAHCQEWADAWNSAESIVRQCGAATVIPLYTSPCVEMKP